jgi:hypothetical protein
LHRKSRKESAGQEKVVREKIRGRREMGKSGLGPADELRGGSGVAEKGFHLGHGVRDG